jgi:exopolysaccharide production protein ExoQ
MSTSPLSSRSLNIARVNRAPARASTSVSSVGFFESAAVVLALLFFSGAFLSEDQGYATDAVKQSNLSLFFIQFLVYLMFLPFIVENRKIILRAFKALYLIWFLVGLVFLSAAWSEVPADTLKHGVLLLGTTVFGVYYGVRFELDQQLRLLAIVFGISIALSLALGLLVPSYGVMQWEHLGAWRGVYFHRNTLAHMMVIGFAVLWWRGRRWGFGVGVLAGLIGAAVLISLSGSDTGRVLLLVTFLFCVGGPALRWKKSRLVSIATVVITVLVFLTNWAIQNWDRFTVDVMGRDRTLSGRLYVWALCVVMGLRRRWLGYGYGSFWLGPSGPSASIWRALHWPSPNAHNGFLDVFLDIGLVGLFVLLAQCAYVFWQAVKLARRGKTPDTLWPMSYLLIFFIDNLAESDMFKYNSISWVLFVAVTAALLQTSWTAQRATQYSIETRS